MSFTKIENKCLVPIHIIIPCYVSRGLIWPELVHYAITNTEKKVRAFYAIPYLDSLYVQCMILRRGLDVFPHIHFNHGDVIKH